MQPVVSIILTIYKRTNYIKTAIESVLNQTYSSYEIIVTDDSNNPIIKSICDSFQNPKIHYRSNPINLGVALNIREAILESSGKYIAILNDDDCWEPDFLHQLVTPLEHYPEVVLSFCNHWAIDEHGEILTKETEYRTKLYGREILHEGIFVDLENFVLKKNGVPLAMSSVFRKDAIDIDLIVNEVTGAYDFWISCLLASTGRPAYFVKEKLTRYRLHDEMETRRKAPDIKENLVFIYKKLIELNLFPQNSSFLKASYSDMLRYFGVDNLEFKNYSVARAYIINSIKVKPNFRSLIAILLSYLPYKVCMFLIHFKRNMVIYLSR